MKLKWGIAVVVAHMAFAMYETAALYLTGNGVGRYGTPATLRNFIEAFSIRNEETGYGRLDFTLDLWSDESLKGTMINAFGSTYRLITFGGYETFLGSGSEVAWISFIPSLFGHLVMAVILWRLASVVISSVVSFLR